MRVITENNNWVNPNGLRVNINNTKNISNINQLGIFSFLNKNGIKLNDSKLPLVEIGFWNLILINSNNVSSPDLKFIKNNLLQLENFFIS